ncbi:MAG: DUF4389 domain-containing protein [Thermoleophilia bacterium]
MSTPAAEIRGYPASLQIDYPEKANRVTSIFRLFTIIPIAIIMSLVSGADWSYSSTVGDTTYHYSGATAGGLMVLPLVLMILFRKKYPRWWFDWNLALTRFTTRVGSYALLLQHEYPSTDEEQGVHLELVYPDAERDLGRGMPLVKWLLAIPHFVILIFLWLAAGFITFITWFVILFTGRNPRGMFDFVVGVLRWSLRVQAYAILLTTDEYPPFSLEP